MVRNWLRRIGAKTLFYRTRQPVRVRSFNGKLRDELLNGEVFYNLKKTQIVIEQWLKHYNTVRYRPPAPQTMYPFQTPVDKAAQVQ